jgi:hypothetical protein
MCRANLLPTALSWDEVVAALDQRFGPQEEGTWTELVEIDGEDIVRSFLRGENETLVIETNSVERLERLYVVLREIGIDVEIIEDERLELEEAACRSRRPDAVTPGPSAPPSADMLNMVSDYMRKRENAWLDEKIPALGGLTPRQAADDPTRREDLIALLNEFKHSEQRNVDGGAAFDADSLKRQLNLD